MIETYSDENGIERCDNCGQPVDDCYCDCSNCGDHVTECCCDDGPAYPAVMED